MLGRARTHRSNLLFLVGCFSAESEHPSHAELDGVTVAVVEDALMIREIMLPLDPGVNGVVVVEV